MEMLLESKVLSRADRPQLLFVGDSIAAMGCRPAMLQAHLPDYQCNNFAIPAANVAVMRQTVEEILRSLPPRIRSGSAVVVFMNYWCFARDSFRGYGPADAGESSSPPMTSVDIAMQRFPLILDTANPVRRMLPAALIRAAKERFRIWRLVAVDWFTHPGDSAAKLPCWKVQTPVARAARLQRETAASPRPKTFHEMTLEEQVASLDRDLGTLGDEFDRDQCENLVTLVRKATGAGMQVVIIEPPLPSRHRHGAPRLEPAKRRIAELVAPFVETGSAIVVDLTDALGDECFRDYAHPALGLPELEIWASLVADTLRGVLRPQSPRIRD
jgi:hypothetical protein